MPFCFLKNFGGNSCKHFFSAIKVTISETSTEIFRKVFFVTCLKVANTGENLELFKQLFLIKPVKGVKLKKQTVFLQKVSHILLNYVFLLFWSIFGEIHRELFFLDIKVIIVEMSTKILKKFVFPTMFEKRQIVRKIWICLNNCFHLNE